MRLNKENKKEKKRKSWAKKGQIWKKNWRIWREILVVDKEITVLENKFKVLMKLMTKSVMPLNTMSKSNQNMHMTYTAAST